MSRVAKSITATVESASGGGFTAVASTPSLDRDGEVLAAGCFNPLPPTVPVHLDHSMSAATIIGRAAPYYSGGDLHINAMLASTDDAQVVRQKLAEGVLDSISVVFLGHEWEQRAGVRTCVRAELLAADVVSVPSQSAARVLSVRGYDNAAALLGKARRLSDEARMATARADLAEAKRLLAALDRPARRGTHRAQVDAYLRNLG